MAGDWIKIEHTMPDKPEVSAIASSLSIEHDAVVGKLLRLWIWADQQSVDGNAIGVTPAFIDRLTNCPGFFDVLVKVGWLKDRNGRISVPNFDRHNGQTAKSRALTSNRVKRSRNVRSVTDSLPEKRREEKSIEDSISTGCIDSLRLPPPFHQPAVSNKFREWFAYLAKRGKPPIDAALAASQAIQFFTAPDNLIRSIAYAIAQGYVTLKDYSDEIARSCGSSQQRTSRNLPTGSGQVHPDDVGGGF